MVLAQTRGLVTGMTCSGSLMPAGTRQSAMLLSRRSLPALGCEGGEVVESLWKFFGDFTPQGVLLFVEKITLFTISTK